MRQLINKYGYIIAVVAVVVGGVWYWLSTRGPEVVAGPTRVYYVDVETGEESTQDASAIPPLMGKGGKPTLVRASKYSCDGGKTRTTYMLSTYPPQVAEELRQLRSSDAGSNQRRAQLEMKELLVRSPEKGSQWYPSNSRQGVELSTIPACPDGKAGEVVYP